MTSGIGFCSILYGVAFGSVRFLAEPGLWFMVRFVLAGFGFIPISTLNAFRRWSVSSAPLNSM